MPVTKANLGHPLVREGPQTLLRVDAPAPHCRTISRLPRARVRAVAEGLRGGHDRKSMRRRSAQISNFESGFRPQRVSLRKWRAFLASAILRIRD